MENVKQTARIALGVTSILFGVALLVLALTARGALMQIGGVGSFGLVDILVLAGLIVPPVIVGLHTLILRPRRDPYWNDKTFRAIGVVQFVSIIAHLYNILGSGRGPGLFYIAALTVIGWVCIETIRRAPGGVDALPAKTGDSIDP